MAKRTSKKDSARKLAIEAARIAHDNQSQDVVVLDLRGISPVTDYFVICTATSGRQMRAVAEKIADYGESVGQPVWHSAGAGRGQWAVLDFVDVVLHVFDETRRRYYDLELIWGAAPKVRWKRRSRTGGPAEAPKRG
ncbi:MAG TPA: ribosome silencing factor [Phycisphaerae bacterium]|nr:ribosome silencing factor [Phycisphaerae bacterium]